MGTVARWIEWAENFELPSPKVAASAVLLSFFIVTAGVAYDIILEPPAVGGVQDPATGKIRPQAFMPYRMNGQYIVEGLVGASMYVLGAGGLILLSESLSRQQDPKYRQMKFSAGAVMTLLAYLAVMGFFRIKLPSYLYWNE